MIEQEYQRVIPYEYVHFISVYQALCENGQPLEKYYIDGLHINDDWL